MKWLLLAAAMLIAAGPAAASDKLFYKAPPSARPVPSANPVHLHRPARENDLFPRFLEWLKKQVSNLDHVSFWNTAHGGEVLTREKRRASR